MFATPDVGRPKAEVAKERIGQINPNVQVTVYREKFSSENAMKMIKDYDIVIDGTDNFPTRYLVNDACVFPQKTQYLRQYFPL